MIRTVGELVKLLKEVSADTPIAIAARGNRDNRVGIKALTLDVDVEPPASSPKVMAATQTVVLLPASALVIAIEQEQRPPKKKPLIVHN